MTAKPPTEHHLEPLSLTEGCTGSSESTPVKMRHCWKSHVTAQMSFICDKGSRTVSFSSISTTDGRSRRPHSLLKLHAWAIQTANIKLPLTLFYIYIYIFLMQGLVKFSSDYGSRAASFSPIATTDGWSRKPQPLLKLHMHKVSCSWTHHSDYAIFFFFFFFFFFLGGGGGGGGAELIPRHFLSYDWWVSFVLSICVNGW